MTFTFFDIITFTVILVSTLLGLYKGFVNIIINLLGFIASIVVAVVLYPYVNDLFSPYIASQLVSPIVSGIFSYIVSLILFTFLTSKVNLLFADYTGGAFDRFLGLITGFVRGAILAIILFIPVAIITSGSYTESENAREVLTKLNKDKYPEWLKNSISTDYYQSATLNIVIMLPTDSLESIKLPGKKPLQLDGNLDDKAQDKDADVIEPDNEELLNDDALAEKFLEGNS